MSLHNERTTQNLRFGRGSGIGVGNYPKCCFCWRPNARCLGTFHDKGTFDIWAYLFTRNLIVVRLEAPTVTGLAEGLLWRVCLEVFPCSHGLRQSQSRGWSKAMALCQRALVNRLKVIKTPEIAWWTFRIFLKFFCLGEGKGESEAPEGGGGRFLLKVPGGGGVSR